MVNIPILGMGALSGFIGFTSLWWHFLVVERALVHNFGSKKGLGAIFYESSYAVTWGSLRMRSRLPPPM